MAKREDFKLTSERIDAEHPLGNLVPLGRFEWEKILLRCRFPQTSVKYVGLTVATWATTTTGANVRPGLANLSAVTGLSDRPLRRYLKELERFGLLHMVSSGSNFGRAGKGKASVYQLTAPEDIALTFEAEYSMGNWAPEQQWDMESVIGQHAQPTIETYQAEEHRSPTTDDNQGSPVAHDRSYAKNTGRLELSPVVCDISPVVSSTNTGRPRPPKSVLPLQESSPQLTNPQAASSSVSQLTTAHVSEEAAAFAAEIVEDDGFTEFWNHYPRKVGKRKAEIKYKAALKRASAETINAAAQQLANDPNRPELRYIKHPTTWLEGDCWNDPPYERRLTNSERRMQAGYEAMKQASIQGEKPNPFEVKNWGPELEEPNTSPFDIQPAKKQQKTVWDTPTPQIENPQPAPDLEDLGEQPAQATNPTEILAQPKIDANASDEYTAARDKLMWLPDEQRNHLFELVSQEHPDVESSSQRAILAAQKLGR
ncbi:hypothetical protein GCM10027417_24000 [Glutamicibacter endophyticus]